MDPIISHKVKKKKFISLKLKTTKLGKNIFRKLKMMKKNSIIITNALYKSNNEHISFLVLLVILTDVAMVFLEVNII